MKKEKSRLSGYMLIAVFVIPLFIAIAMYSLRDYLPTANTVSNGELIHPAEPIQVLDIQSRQGNFTSIEDLNGKWVYLVYAPDGCNLECEATLFKLRQVKASTGRETNRIKMALLLDSSQLETNIAKRNKNVLVGKLTRFELESDPGTQKELVPGYVYLLDPLGNMMMKYDITATSKGILKDIKKLLKISNIG